MEDLVLEILIEIKERILSPRLAGPLKMKSTTLDICFQVLLMKEFQVLKYHFLSNMDLGSTVLEMVE